MMNENLITIPFDFTPCNVELSSYQEVVAKMQLGQPITTHCLNFFSFSTLDRGYDVKVVTKNGDYILLSDLLNNDGIYTNKIIRNAHNVMNLLLSNGFEFKKSS